MQFEVKMTIRLSNLMRVVVKGPIPKNSNVGNILLAISIGQVKVGPNSVSQRMLYGHRRYG